MDEHRRHGKGGQGEVLVSKHRHLAWVWHALAWPNKLGTDPMAIDGTCGRRRGKQEKEEDLVSKNQVQSERSQDERLARDGTTEPTRIARPHFLARRGTGKQNPFQATTSRIDNHTRLIYIVLKVLAIRICMHKRFCLHAQRVVGRRPILQCSCTVIVLCADVLSASAVPN